MMMVVVTVRVAAMAVIMTGVIVMGCVGMRLAQLAAPG